MALFNYATKELTLKIVYYGPGLSGKTTNLQYLHSILNPDTKGKLLSLSTESDRTLFFDFLPIELGKIRDFSIRFQLYTVPGQVRYNATRKVVLKGADGIVFVADSQREMREQNTQSIANMRDNFFTNNINPDEIPIVLQYNKRDLKNICTIDELNSDLNPYNYPVTEATAINGHGVEESFKLITKLLLKYISKKHKLEIQPIRQVEEVPEEISDQEPEAEPEPSLTEAITIPTEEEIPTLERYDDRIELIPEYKAEEKVSQPEINVSAPIPASDGAVDAITKIPDVSIQPEIQVSPPIPASDRAVDAMKEIIDSLSGRIDNLAHEVEGFRETLQGLQKTTDNLSLGLKDAEEVKQGQANMLNLLKDLASTINGLKEKKSWFKF